MGGGITYFPDDEPDRHHVRPMFVLGEELPAFKRHPVWFVLDVRVEQYRRNILKAVRFSGGVRIDVTVDPDRRPE